MATLGVLNRHTWLVAVLVSTDLEHFLKHKASKPSPQLESDFCIEYIQVHEESKIISCANLNHLVALLLLTQDLSFSVKCPPTLCFLDMPPENCCWSYERYC